MMHPLIKSNSASTSNPSARRFGDCALVEIIHLHDCLRGAIAAMQKDIEALSKEFASTQASSGIANVWKTETLERKIAARFKVIWSVFKAHSEAEDEFIWPTLRDKLGTKRLEDEKSNTTPSKAEKNLSSPVRHSSSTSVRRMEEDGVRNNIPGAQENSISSNIPQNLHDRVSSERNRAKPNQPKAPITIEEESYAEDHADEERMFMQMNSLLSELRQGIVDQKKLSKNHTEITSEASKENVILPDPSPKFAKLDDITKQLGNSTHLGSLEEYQPFQEVLKITQSLEHMTSILSTHLFQHLEKEETHCMPLVKKHLNRGEINDLVGRIMGKRSSDIMMQILTLAIQNLPEEDRHEMVKYMKQAMVGTFFERWLVMGGFFETEGNKKASTEHSSLSSSSSPRKNSTENTDSRKRIRSDKETDAIPQKNATNSLSVNFSEICSGSVCRLCKNAGECPVNNVDSNKSLDVDITTQEGLNKMIRAVASNPELSAMEKNTTIQGLRDSVWRTNKKRKMSEDYSHANAVHGWYVCSWFS